MRRCTFLIVAFLAAGCGSEEAAPPAAQPREPPPPNQAEREPRRATCPASAANCEAATGRVIFLESVDPDGDGDLHLVIAGGGVTGPGFSVLDIGRDLRPKRDPRIGDTASAAGPVYRGSYGQRQIEATELFITRR